MTDIDAPILIAYDGSENAAHAITVASRLLGGGPAELIHVWEPAFKAAARAAIYLVPFTETEDTIEREKSNAATVADRGAALARAAGFDVTAAAVESDGALWHAIVDRAEVLEPKAIVMGTRGLTGVRSSLGSVSQHVSSHASVPVLTVPMDTDDALR